MQTAACSPLARARRAAAPPHRPASLNSQMPMPVAPTSAISSRSCSNVVSGVVYSQTANFGAALGRRGSSHPSYSRITARAIAGPRRAAGMPRRALERIAVGDQPRDVDSREPAHRHPHAPLGVPARLQPRPDRRVLAADDAESPQVKLGSQRERDRLVPVVRRRRRSSLRDRSTAAPPGEPAAHRSPRCRCRRRGPRCALRPPRPRRPGRRLRRRRSSSHARAGWQRVDDDQPARRLARHLRAEGADDPEPGHDHAVADPHRASSRHVNATE